MYARTGERPVGAKQLTGGLDSHTIIVINDEAEPTAHTIQGRGRRCIARPCKEGPCAPSDDGNSPRVTVRVSVYGSPFPPEGRTVGYGTRGNTGSARKKYLPTHPVRSFVTGRRKRVSDRVVIGDGSF